MAEEEKKVTVKVCGRLDAAYGKMKAEQNQENYIGMLQALEADLKDNACAFVPLSVEDVEAMKKSQNEVKFAVVDAQQGRLLALYTSQEQAVKRGLPGGAVIPLQAFFQALLGTNQFAGFAVNPSDDTHGFVLDRKNLELAFRRSRGLAPQLPQPLIAEAVKKLFGCAVGLPAKVTREAPEDLAKLGGPDGVLKPILEKWQWSIQKGVYTPTSADDYVKTVVKDVMTTAFVSGVLVRKDPKMVKDADVSMCIDRVPYLKDDLVQNTDQYLVVLSELARQAVQVPDDAHLWKLLADNLGIICFGAMLFGFGWGISKYEEISAGE